MVGQHAPEFTNKYQRSAFYRIHQANMGFFGQYQASITLPHISSVISYAALGGIGIRSFWCAIASACQAFAAIWHHAIQCIFYA